MEAASPPTAPRESARPATGPDGFDATYDIVVVGGGRAGLPTALFARWLGNRVLVLEKAPELGGTARKAAFWYWVPNNQPMRELGLEDPRDDCLRYMARLARPHRYRPDAPRFGLTEWEYAVCEAIYDGASPATELLAERDALPYRHCAAVPDYWCELPEDKAPTGRVLVPADARETMSDGGAVAIRTLSAAAVRDGVEVRTGHRVQRVVRDEGGRVVGVEATTADGATVRVGAAKAVVFATGGFTHDPELRQNFLNVPVYGGCAAASNEGDFVYIAGALGAQLRNMNYAWMCPVSLEKAVARDPAMSGMFFQWDPAAAEYPYLVLVAIWDQRSQDHSASDEYGRLIVPPGTDDAHVIRGDDLAALAAAIDERLGRYADVTGGLRLADDFLPILQATVARFNDLATTGGDTDFGRGERAVEQLFNGVVKEEPDQANPTMWPLADTGPYYAALVTGGTWTPRVGPRPPPTGGPKATPDGQVLDDQDRPIPGLYGVGNCVASASAQAYWAGGATLGPILALAHRARPGPPTPSGSPSRSPSADRQVVRKEPAMGETGKPMTDEDRKALVIEYLKAFDRAGVTTDGGSILDLFADDAQVYFPKWGVAKGREQIGQMFGDVGGTLKAIEHHYELFNWVFTGGDVLAVEGTSHGEHRDGPWRAGDPEHGAGRWCDVFEIRDGKIQRCFIYLDPDYAGQDTGRYPWLAARQP
jgi:3-oxosteroid 1-dehydrogenase